MLEPFIIKALLAGIGTALMCGTLGCFVAWKRLAYYGDTIAHAALLGVAVALMLETGPGIGILLVSILLAIGVTYFSEQKQLAADTILGVAAHGALAIGVVLLSLSSITVDIGAFLFGDILAVVWSDVIVIYVVVAAILMTIKYFWRDLMRITIHPDIAQVEGVHATRSKLVLMVLIAVAVAISIKIVGMLLITALLIVPAAAARYFSATPTQMVQFSTLAAVVSVLMGIGGAFTFDTPSGPSIVVAALVLFLGAHVTKRVKASK